MMSTRLKRLMVVGLVAGMSFVTGLMMFPPPEQAQAIERGVAKCLLEHLEHVGSDTAAGLVYQACDSLY